MKIALLTGGSDKPYALGMVATLVSRGITIDFVGSDELECEELLRNEQVRFLNFRGDTSSEAPRLKKIARIAKYYSNVMLFALKRQPVVFHILWANRFLLMDRVLSTLYFKAIGKKLVLTAHNVNERRRDGRDSVYNRLTLRALYVLVDHIFVHTEKMRSELIIDFGINAVKVSVIPFGINNTLPNTVLTRAEARARLGLGEAEKVLLFFGRIAKYKGLEYAIEALGQLVGDSKGHDIRLVVAGRLEEGCEGYWKQLESAIRRLGLGAHVTTNLGFIADEEVELYFKSADALVLPYRAIFQSGVLFLAYSFGLPVIASNVGSFRDDIVEGRTGMIFRPEDAIHLAETIDRYFDSDLFGNLDQARREIAAFGNHKYSWDEVGERTCSVYKQLCSKKAIAKAGQGRAVL